MISGGYVRLGFRVLVLLLLLAGVVPATLVLVAETRAYFATVRDQARDEVSAMARLVAEQHQRAVDVARGTLLAISRLPAVLATDAAGCTRAVTAIGAETDLWANMGAVYPDGRMFCSAFPMPASVNLADRPFIRNALRTGDVGTGTRVLSRVRGIGAFGFGYPVRDARGDIVAVTFASLRIDAIQRQLDELPLSPHVSIEVIDRAGAIVTSRHAAEGGPGAFGPDVARLAMRDQLPRELTEAGGSRRILGSARVEAVDGTAMWVVAGVPAEVIEGPVRAVTFRTLFTWGVAMLAVILGTGFIAEFLIIRRLSALSRAAARIAGGDYGARTGLDPGRDELGQFVGAFDHMAASLEELQRQNRLLLDSIGDGIVGVDREACVVFANPAAERLLGVPLQEMKGGPFAALVRHAGPRSDPCLVRQSLHDREVHLAADDAFTRRDGKAFPVESVTTPVVDGGRVVGAVVALRDATERRRLEDQLRQAQKMEAVGQLAGGIAHDFNNLLTAIITCGRMVQEALPPSHPAQPDVEEILSSGDRAAQLTRQLLAFARRQQLAPRPMDLRQSVTGMERMLRRLLGEHVALRCETGDRPIVIRADPGQIEMVVLNLAVNARDAMPGGGDLTLSVGSADAADPALAGGEPLPEGPLGELVVRDTGVGMDPDTQDRIFEPFFSTKASGQGTGLGLATVYGIVKQSGGALRVRSAPGEGTEFRVLFPLYDGAAEVQPRTAAPPAGGTERILVLEDDDVLRALVCRALRGAGYRVAEASRPSAALERAAEGELDLLVTDLVLPEESGWSLFRKVAARRPGLRVLLMSGFSGALEPGSGSLPKEVPFLAKPFAPHDLLGRVRLALDGPPPAI